MRMAFDYPGHIPGAAMSFFPADLCGTSENVKIGDRVRVNFPPDWENSSHDGLRRFDNHKGDYEVIALATVPLDPRKESFGVVAILAPFLYSERFKESYLDNNFPIATNFSYSILTTKMLDTGTGWDPRRPVLAFPIDSLEKI